MTERFSGFPADALTFLSELTANNTREWFEPMKERYEASVRGPALAFISAMTDPIQSVSPHFTAIAKKTGGSLMRPYRDIRFSPDKTPYKTNVGIQFRHEVGKDVHAPGFYLHISADESFVGVGLWRPDKIPLADIRSAISDSPDEYRGIITGKRFTSKFALEGESLKRPPKGFDPDHPLIAEIMRKDFIASHNMTSEAIVDDTLISTVTGLFRASAPWVEFLCGALGLDF
jgi:uncharacterized protein (TIGR02453 family)